MKNQDYVLASEIADYIYCQCCFFDTLEGKKEKTIEMEQGTLQHEVQAEQITFLENLQKFAAFLVISSLVFLSVALLLWHFFKPV